MSPTPNPGDVLVLAGTKKGLFAFWADEAPRDWRRRLMLDRRQVHATAYDPRNGALYATANGEVFGGVAQRSDDLGQSWVAENHGLDFDAETDFRVRRVWQGWATGRVPGCPSAPGDCLRPRLASLSA